MSSLGAEFAKSWKEQVFDVACEKSLDLIKNYKNLQSTEATSEENLEKTEADNEETFKSSKNDNAEASTSQDLNTNGATIQDESEVKIKIEVKENEDKKSSVNINVMQDEKVDTDTSKHKEKITTRCQRFKTYMANFQTNFCICSVVTSCLCCGLLMVPLFFLGRCLCCNCPSFENGKSSSKVEKETKPKVITKSPSRNLDPNLEEVNSKINMKTKQKIAEKT